MFDIQQNPLLIRVWLYRIVYLNTEQKPLLAQVLVHTCSLGSFLPLCCPTVVISLCFHILAHSQFLYSPAPYPFNIFLQRNSRFHATCCCLFFGLCKTSHLCNKMVEQSGTLTNTFHGLYRLSLQHLPSPPTCLQTSNLLHPQWDPCSPRARLAEYPP